MVGVSRNVKQTVSREGDVFHFTGARIESSLTPNLPSSLLVTSLVGELVGLVLQKVNV